MVRKEIPVQAHIHASSLHPFKKDGPLTILPSHGKLIKDVFGQVGWNHVRDYLRNIESTDNLPLRPSTKYLESLYGDQKHEGLIGKIADTVLQVNNMFGLEHRYYDRDFRADYLSAQGDTNDAIKMVMEKLGLPGGVNGLREGVTATSDSLHSDMVKILKAPEDINPIYRFQLLVQQLLTVPGLELNKSHRAKQMRNELKEFVDWAENGIFNVPGGRLGDTENVVVFSLHRKNTNYTGKHDFLVNVPFHKNKIRQDMIMRKTELSVRKCVIDGEEFKVHFNTRKKSDAAALIKTLAKALNRSVDHNRRVRRHIHNKMKLIGHDDSQWDKKYHEALIDALCATLDPDPKVNREMRLEELDQIRITKDVVDIIGTEIVVVEGDPKKFTELFVNELEKKYGKVKDDSKVDKNRGQSAHRSFIRKILPNGAGTEIIIETLPEYINSKRHIGVFDEAGFPNGDAHSIYDILRIGRVAKILFPNQIYPDLDIDAYIKMALSKAILELRKSDTVTPE